jgi:hypothetical protein
VNAAAAIRAEIAAPAAPAPIMGIAELAKRDPSIGLAGATAPAAPAPDYKARFETMVYMIGEISNALGIPDDESSCANGNDLILSAIAKLRAPAPAAQADERVALGKWSEECKKWGHPATHEARAAFIDGYRARQQSATPPECTCPSGNGSLRHPCPVHVAEPVARVIREPGASEFKLAWLNRPGPNGTLLYATPADAASEADVRAQGFKDCIDAIRGAIAFGQQGTNHAPTGHWLAEFWDIGSKLAASNAGERDRLHKFLNAAAGEGFVLDGVDAADLYIALFPAEYAAACSSIDAGADVQRERQQGE